MPRILFARQSGGGYVTDEELELCQTIEERGQSEETGRRRHPTSGTGTEGGAGGSGAHPAEDIQSPSKEVLIADNESRR